MASQLFSARYFEKLLTEQQQQGQQHHPDTRSVVLRPVEAPPPVASSLWHGESDGSIETAPVASTIQWSSPGGVASSSWPGGCLRSNVEAQESGQQWHHQSSRPYSELATERQRSTETTADSDCSPLPARQPKRHERPAHKEAETRRLFKIRKGIQQLSATCRKQQLGEQPPKMSEAATLKECYARMLEAERTVAEQRDEIDQLRRRLAASAMPAGQAIDFVQTKWLESPKFEKFYKLLGKSVTKAFVTHVTAQQQRATEIEKFPDQWLGRVKQDEVMRRSARHLQRATL